ncbi:MAG: HEAT repeat domain-containing protein [Myxococcota bacterium]|nr:HEAT repeat domain-containing protein [Myxococcota bacterium]MDW8360915.1 HEAT repeat domain-containing protein [Myxococcales bacterium]
MALRAVEWEAGSERLVLRCGQKTGRRRGGREMRVGGKGRGLYVAAVVTVLASAAMAFAPPSPSPVAVAQQLSEEELRRQLDALRSSDPSARVAAAETLGRRAYAQRREVAPALRELLRNDPDWRVRASCGRALGRLGIRDAVPDLVRALRDPQVDVRVVAAAALWRLPDPAAVPALLELLSDDDAAARQWAVLALGVIRDQRATQPLVQLLARESTAAVRLDVIRSLGRIGDSGALGALRDVARNASRPADERVEAVHAIASLATPEKVNALVGMLDEPDRRIRLRVVRALGDVGDALALPAVRRRRERERDAQIRTALDEAQAAIRGRMGGEGTGPVAPSR